MDGNEVAGTEAAAVQAGADSATGSAPSAGDATQATAVVEPKVPAGAEKPAAAQPEAAAAVVENPNEVKVSREEWERDRKDAAAFRSMNNTEAKLKGRYANLEFVSKYCENMPRDLCMQILPDTEDENALHKANKALSDSICAFLRQCEAKGQIVSRSLGGSAGGHAPQANNNSGMSAGQLLGMKQR